MEKNDDIIQNDLGEDRIAIPARALPDGGDKTMGINPDKTAAQRPVGPTTSWLVATTATTAPASARLRSTRTTGSRTRTATTGGRAFTMRYGRFDMKSSSTVERRQTGLHLNLKHHSRRLDMRLGAYAVKDAQCEGGRLAAGVPRPVSRRSNKALGRKAVGAERDKVAA